MEKKRYWQNCISVIDTSKEEVFKKDILKAENFNIVLVHLGKDKEISPHPEPYGVFFLVLQGSGILAALLVLRG
ncbi:MAG: hypothetical protein ACTSRI_11950 [Promethearchaeota archaeon]